MDSYKIKKAASALAEAWLRAGSLAEMLPDELRAKDRSEAYAVQDAMAAVIGLPVAGWKMGATSPAVIRKEGHSGPIVGRIFASTVFESPALIPYDRFPWSRIEAEFAVRAGVDFPPRSTPYLAADLIDNVSVLPALEIIGNRYPKGTGAPRLSTFDEIADNGTGQGLILGNPFSTWTKDTLREIEINVFVEDGAPSLGFVGDDRCDPLEVMVETLNMLSERGIGLERGQFVSTGGLTRPLAVATGSRFVARFGNARELHGRFI